MSPPEHSPPSAPPPSDAPPEDRSPFPIVRAGLTAGAPFGWLSDGLDDFKACKTASLFYGACFVVMGWALVFAFKHAVQLITAVTTGFFLVGPFFAIGLYELSRRRERKLPPDLGPTLAVWKANAAAIGIYSLVLIVLYLLWARASMVTFALFYSGGIPTMATFVAEVARFDNLEFLLAYFVVGGIFALLVFAFSVVSIPLMLDRGQDTVTAMIASFLALVRNPAAMVVWALAIVVLAAVGIATAFIGLAITGPLLGHATWHAYRELIGPAGEA